MILKSLIADDSRLTLDCAKATLIKGSKIEIKDAFWFEKEVQNAVKLKMIELVGEPPAPPPEVVISPEKKVKLKNVDPQKRKITLDCVKALIGPGEVVEIPTSVMHLAEVQNAISWGLLCDPNEPVKEKELIPVDLQEVKLQTGTAPVAAPKLPLGRSRPKVAKGPIKAKPITSKHDASGDDDETSGEELYKESKVHDPDANLKIAAKRQVERPKPTIVEPDPPKKNSEDWDDNDAAEFLDIFK